MVYFLYFYLIMVVFMFIWVNFVVELHFSLVNNETGEKIEPNKFWTNVINIIASVFWFTTIILLMIGREVNKQMSKCYK